MINGEKSPEFEAARTAANNARTDLYDFVDGEWKPQNDKQFDESYKQTRAMQRAAASKFGTMKGMMPGAKPK
jgi:hypothetical protein